MFSYKISDLKLMNEDDRYLQLLTASTSAQDKIAFINEKKNGYASKLLKAKQAFEADSANGAIKFRTDVYGNAVPNTNSLRAWINKVSEAKQVLNNGNLTASWTGRLNYHHMDAVTIYTDFHRIDRVSSYFVFSEIIDEMFYDLLKELRTEEVKYFKEHDKYEVNKSRVKEYLNKYHVTFNYKSIITSTSGEMYVTTNTYEDRTVITIEQLDDLLDKYHQVDALIDELSK